MEKVRLLKRVPPPESEMSPWVKRKPLQDLLNFPVPMLPFVGARCLVVLAVKSERLDVITEVSVGFDEMVFRAAPLKEFRKRGFPRLSFVREGKEVIVRPGNGVGISENA